MVLSRRCAYSRLNLRWNPFSEPSPAERPALVVGDVSALAARLGDERVCLQLRGAHGRGKTSRLLALHAALGAPYIRLRDQHALPPGAPVLLLDEGELLWRRPWWRLRRCRALAVSTHRPLWWLRGLGFRVETVWVDGLDAAGLAALVARRLAWARRGPGPVPQVPPRTIAALLDQHGSDVRTIEAALYHGVEQLQEIGDVEVHPQRRA